ncbi:MAG TPA: TonB family protein [Vicinamibacteria bacterium]|jgi:TonB family protein|nr:TonB family protein [Vicinamibacteria bacterium]
MAKRERFGKLVLLEETDSTGLGPEYRAAKLGPAGLEKLVTILRLKPAISGNAETARSLMDQAKLAAQLQNPNILRIFGIGKVDQTYYISYEFIEGKNLRAILERCRQEAFPFSVEHALLIASKVCSALEGAQARRLESGDRYFHGLLNPGCILVSYEGEVRVKGFGYWPSRLRDALPEETLAYLAPEQAAGGAGDGCSDVYSLGAVLFEMLTGQSPAGADLAARIPVAKLQSPAGEDDSLSPPLVEILQKALGAEPSTRYSEVQEMRKAIDALLFSGDFTPTTFNLAFFMHSLYRDDIEQEAKAVKEDREASYHEFVAEEAKPQARPLTPEPSPARTESVEAKAPAPPRAEANLHPEPVTAPPPAAPAPLEVSPGHSPKEAAAGFTFHKGASRSQTPLLVGAAAILLIAGVGYYFLSHTTPPPPVQAPPTLSAEAVAAEKRVKELEDKLAGIEAERVAAEGKAAEEAKKKLEAQAKARGQAVDPTALQQVQDDARKQAKAEQEAKQREELRNLAEQRKAEEARLAEERRKAEELARAEQVRAAEQAPPPSAPAATPEPTPAPPAPIRPGTLVNLSDSGVIAPVAEKSPPLQYPPIALRQRVEGTVELNVFVDERGNVSDAQVVQAAGGKAGLNEAAVENVKRRHYRPATKDGVPVKVWMSVRVRFELPK